MVYSKKEFLFGSIINCFFSLVSIKIIIEELYYLDIVFWLLLILFFIFGFYLESFVEILKKRHIIFTILFGLIIFTAIEVERRYRFIWLNQLIISAPFGLWILISKKAWQIKTRRSSALNRSNEENL